MILLAYIDPGLGALVWQTILAAFVGFLFYLKKTRRWIVSAVLKIFGRAQRPPDTGSETSVTEKVETKSDAR